MHGGFELWISRGEGEKNLNLAIASAELLTFLVCNQSSTNPRWKQDKDRSSRCYRCRVTCCDSISPKVNRKPQDWQVNRSSDKFLVTSTQNSNDLTRNSNDSKLERLDSRLDTRSFRVSRIEVRIESFELWVTVNLHLTGTVPNGMPERFLGCTSRGQLLLNEQNFQYGWWRQIITHIMKYTIVFEWYQWT